MRTREFILLARTLLLQDWTLRDSTSYDFGVATTNTPYYTTSPLSWRGGGLTFKRAAELLKLHSNKLKVEGHGWAFRLNEYCYWCPRSEVVAANCIVRAKLALPHHVYDGIADEYVEMFEDEESKAEEVELFSKMKITGRVLDIGCGAGLLLDYFKPERYCGIDPSQRMLDHLVAKHDEYGDCVECVPFENFYRGSFDTIVSIFGAASYIDPEVLIPRVSQMLTPGGRAYLMYFAPEYTPVTHEKLGVSPKSYCAPEGYAVERFNNYDIVML